MVLVEVVELHWLAGHTDPIGYTRVVPFMEECERNPELDQPPNDEADLVLLQKTVKLLDEGGPHTLGAAEVPASALCWVWLGPDGVQTLRAFPLELN